MAAFFPLSLSLSLSPLLFSSLRQLISPAVGFLRENEGGRKEKASIILSVKCKEFLVTPPRGYVKEKEREEGKRSHKKISLPRRPAAFVSFHEKTDWLVEKKRGTGTWKIFRLTEDNYFGF